MPKDLQKAIEKIYYTMVNKDLIIIVCKNEEQHQVQKPTESQMEEYIKDENISWILTGKESASGLERLKKKARNKNLNQILKHYKEVWSYHDGKYRFF